MRFQIVSKFKPTIDQEKAGRKLIEGLKAGRKHQTLLGVTGSGKTFTMAKIIEAEQRPALIISPNKTLAAQLFQELKSFFPANAVHYFVSYYDYYQPEAYLPPTDTYIEKDAKINEFIDHLRHAATASLFERPDTIIIASVSCIYGIGDPAEYEKISLNLKVGEKISQRSLLKQLAILQYERSLLIGPGLVRAYGDEIEIGSPTGQNIILIEINKNQIVRITSKENEKRTNKIKIRIFPAKHFVTPQKKIKIAILNIKKELKKRLEQFKSEKKFLEAQRLEQKTKYDLELLEKIGYAHGIENYSRHLSFRAPGEPPFTLLDYFPENFLTVIDESHLSIPQIRGMHEGDRQRKQILVDYGFRLPSALDNRPLKFDEFEKKVSQAIYVSATPGPYELKKSENIAEQLIRPQGLLDPKIEIRPTKNQVENLIEEVKKRKNNNERVLILTITKRLAEDLNEFLKERDINVNYIHSEIKTLERPKILNDLRRGKYDAIVGVNLLREGLDLPEVSLVIILDADKEGFLRGETSLIQIIGRTARHSAGQVIMYADNITGSMRKAIEETKRRRQYQEAHNKKFGVIPQTISKIISEDLFSKAHKSKQEKTILTDAFENHNLKTLKRELKKAIIDLNFEQAAVLRDEIKKKNNN
ncbi:MAG: excinuclease ABC subunit UvrB [Parcubacteria group bacterium]|nr:excinuclease ABC subunit UvrB [Parcubacteria group bacterium]